MASHQKDTQLINDLEGFIQNVITHLNPEPAKTRGQPRILPALALWSGILVAVIRGFNAQLEIWRLLTQQGLWDFPRFTIGDDAVYKRLKNADQNTLKTVFEQVTMLLTLNFKAPVQSLAKFASGVFALDEMTLDQVKKRLPNLRSSENAVLIGTITALFDVRQQLWRRIEFHENTLQNERIAARGMLEFIPIGSLILADLGYFAFAWFDELTTKGFYWVSRLRAKTSYKIIHTLYERNGILDAIVWLGAYRADQSSQAVRLVEFTQQGKTWRYLTNVLDPKVLSIREISVLYARRWDIEMMFNLIKTHLKLHLLWSSQLNVVLHQVFAVFTVAQVILATRAEIASRANADVFDISLDLMIRWLPRFASDGVDPVQVLAERGRAAKIIRASNRMKWVPDEVGLDGYSFLSSGTVLVRTARYAGKI
jgi:Transposase DDE domain